jgi:uncharacterized protein YciI
MPVYLCKLSPPRPSFPGDMTAEEAAVMGEHAAYWTQLTESGAAVVFGPVFDPAGVWGLAIVDAADETAARALTDDDPVIRSGRGFGYAIHPMPNAVVRASVQSAR